ncbi:MAG: hypothetical protein RL338_1696 [Chloroflexota bacterium]
MGRLEDDERGVAPAGERAEPLEPDGERRDGTSTRDGPIGKIEDEEIDGAPLEERARHREAVVERGGDEDDEPGEVEPAGGRLDRVEAPRAVEPRDDRAGRLCLGGEPEGERRPAARRGPGDRDARRPGESPGAEDRVERGEAGRADLPRPGEPERDGTDRLAAVDERRGREGGEPARGGRAPSGFEGREREGGGIPGGHRIPDDRTDVLKRKPPGGPGRTGPGPRLSPRPDRPAAARHAGETPRG